MREAFREHHRLTDAEIEAIWKNGVFVLDTNVLLNIYRYASGTRLDLFRVLRHLGKQLWVPRQVAKEFYRHRIPVVLEQRQKYEELERSIRGVLSGAAWGSFRKSGFLKIDELESRLKPALDDATEFINTERSNHPDLIADDVYVEELVEIVGSSIGELISAEQIEADTAQARERISKKVPPGFLDSKKPEPECFGDVFIWFEVLRHAEKTSKPIVFVTDDEKEDWWQVVSGKTLGPRPELRAEIRARANTDLHLTSPARLMQLIGKQLETSVAPSSIDDANRIRLENQENLRGGLETWFEELSRSSESSRQVRWEWSRTAKRLVFDWLRSEFPDASLSSSASGPVDFVVEGRHARVAVDVRSAVRGLEQSILHRLRDSQRRATQLIEKKTFTAYLNVIVAPDSDMAYRISLKLIPRGARPGTSISVGYVEEQRYKELIRFGEEASAADPHDSSPDDRPV